MYVTQTIGLTEAKTNFNKLAQTVNKTGKPITIFKHNRPYITISPAEEILNDESAQAFADLDEIRKDKNIKPYESDKELFQALGI